MKDDVSPTLGWRCMKIRRKLLRENQTNAEIILWDHLKDKRLNGYRFRRQHGIGPYVVDFYHSLSRTVIEIDGLIHKREDVENNDEWREKYLKQRGYTILRLTNEEIEYFIEQSLQIILLKVTLTE